MGPVIAPTALVRTMTRDDGKLLQDSSEPSFGEWFTVAPCRPRTLGASKKQMEQRLRGDERFISRPDALGIVKHQLDRVLYLAVHLSQECAHRLSHPQSPLFTPHVRNREKRLAYILSPTLEARWQRWSRGLEGAYLRCGPGFDPFTYRGG